MPFREVRQAGYFCCRRVPANGGAARAVGVRGPSLAADSPSLTGVAVCTSYAAKRMHGAGAGSFIHEFLRNWACWCGSLFFPCFPCFSCFQMAAGPPPGSYYPAPGGYGAPPPGQYGARMFLSLPFSYCVFFSLFLIHLFSQLVFDLFSGSLWCSSWCLWRAWWCSWCQHLGRSMGRRWLQRHPDQCARV